MKIAFALMVLFFAIIIYLKKPDTVSTRPSSTITSNQRLLPAAPITKEQAAAMISELPEVKAWSGYIERTSEGKVHGSIMVSPEELITSDGKQYWPVDFYESQMTNLHRWASFLVSLDTQEILVDDSEGGIISLQEWRDSKKPMERISGDNAP
ncbi:MAG: hypothetical protein QX199_02880 [Methylococcaceae bacterium]